MLFTTSWDDGYELDLRVCDLLHKFGCTGTFYVCPKQQHGREMLTESKMRMIAAWHEVGAHTIHHPHLTQLNPDDVRDELINGKAWVEKITEKPCTMFCYPYGDENQKIRELTQQVGFHGARGTRTLEFSASDHFDLPVSLQIYPFPWRRKGDLYQRLTDPVPHLRQHGKRLTELHVPWHARRGWLPLAKNLFTHALKTHQPFFHLFGHSHELELYDMWSDFERFLAFVVEHQSDIRSIANSGLL